MGLPDVWTDDNFKISQGTREPGSFRIGKGGGEAVLTLKMAEDVMMDLMTTGMESARANNSTGLINRVLPISHPRYPWMFLSDLQNVQGVSFEEKIEADPLGYLEVASLPFYANYKHYIAQAKFEPRPYALLDDVSVPAYTISWYDEDGASQTKTARAEWWRYTTWLRKPAAEYLTADKGQFQFAVPTDSGINGNPNDASSAGIGQIRKLIPNAVWSLNWFGVPYNYVLSDNTYFTRYIGHVNQKAIWGFDPGEGLLQAVNVTNVYSPPFPEFTTFTGYDVVSQDKLCDIEFVILEAQRSPHVSVTPTNGNNVINGHNCVVYAPNSRYYYAENFRTGAAGSGKAIYPSFPFDLLFQNPDGPA